MRLRHHSIKPILLAAAFSLAVVHGLSAGQTPKEPLEPSIGVQCEVQFRNDVFAHGTESNFTTKGRIKAISEEWLVIDNGSEVWIPRNVIFMITVKTQIPDSAAKNNK